MVGHGDFLAVANHLEVSAEMVPEFAYASFHPQIMAFCRTEI